MKAEAKAKAEEVRKLIGLLSLWAYI